MNFRILFSILFLMSTWTLSGQDWSLGMDMVSLSKFIGGEEGPVMVQIRRSLNERHALRVNLGANHSHKKKESDYFNSGNGVNVLQDISREINFNYLTQLGWQYSPIYHDLFQFYTFSGVFFEFSKNKKINDPELGVTRPILGRPDPEPFIYKRSEFDNHKTTPGIFIILGAEFKLVSNLSLSLESEIRAAYYKEKRNEQDSYIIFDWNQPNPPQVDGFVDDGHYFEETGFEFKAILIQYLFLRYSF